MFYQGWMRDSCFPIAKNWLFSTVVSSKKWLADLFNIFKGTVRAILSELPCKDGNAWFTKVSLKIKMWKL